MDDLEFLDSVLKFTDTISDSDFSFADQNPSTVISGEPALPAYHAEDSAAQGGEMVGGYKGKRGVRNGGNGAINIGNGTSEEKKDAKKSKNLTAAPEPRKPSLDSTKCPKSRKPQLPKQPSLEERKHNDPVPGTRAKAAQPTSPLKPGSSISLLSGSDSESDLVITGFTTNPLKRPRVLDSGSTALPGKRQIILHNGKLVVRRVVRTGPWSSKEHCDFAEAMQNGTDFRGIAELMGRKVEDVFSKFSEVVQAALYRGDLRDRATQT